MMIESGWGMRALSFPQLESAFVQIFLNNFPHEVVGSYCVMKKIECIYLILGQRSLLPVAIPSCLVQTSSQYFLKDSNIHQAIKSNDYILT